MLRSKETGSLQDTWQKETPCCARCWCAGVSSEWHCTRGRTDLCKPVKGTPCGLMFEAS